VEPIHIARIIRPGEWLLFVVTGQVAMARERTAHMADVDHFEKALEMNKSTKFILIGAVSLLAACGTRPSERVQGGAAAGAATGATVGLVGGPPGVAAGAVIGGGAGALTAASTSPRDVNLGRPVWKQQ
jgi:hypothetical protein